MRELSHLARHIISRVTPGYPIDGKIIGKPIDQSISIDKISLLVSIGIGRSMINR